MSLESLNALETSGLLELGELKTYHIRVSDIMRVYAEDRFGVEAMEMTTEQNPCVRCDSAVCGFLRASPGGDYTRRHCCCWCARGRRKRR